MMKKKKRTPLSIALSLVIALVIASSVYLFSQSQIFRDFYVSLLSEEVGLPVDKWEYEGMILASEKYELVNPDIIKTENGYKMYFHDTENIYVALSSDGLNWEIVEKPIFERAGGVAVVQLPDKKFRMYFQHLEAGGAFKSAISGDSINFEVEEGIRFAAGKDSFASIKSIGHPNVIKTEDGYKLYFDTIYDTWLEAKAVDGKCKIPYKEGAPEIHYAYSEDGLNWTYKGKVISFKQFPIPHFIGGWSPGVIKLGKEYRMYFHATRIKVITTNVRDVTNCRFEQILDPLWLATSKDGVNFDIVKQLATFKSDPEVIQIDGKLRLYVWGKNNIYSYIQKIE